jgi:2,3-bisphosphoglycerate-independent phosphoglycerate mutase
MERLLPGNKYRKNGPVVLVVMDGFGLGAENDGNALHLARTPVLDMLRAKHMNTSLKAHGTAVGLPSDDDMGNSEVGHNALGAGRVFSQGAKLVNAAVDTGAIYATDLWKRLVSKPATGAASMHFIGLLSDGNVHSHIEHLLKIIEHASTEGVKKIRIHILLDGRDVPDTSALVYVDRLEDFLKPFAGKGLDYRIASGGGRMVTTMDRYEADWNIVKRGWEAHVLGVARPFRSAREAIETFRSEQKGLTDQYLPSFTIVDDHGPVGPVLDGDSVIFFNFRGDRAIEISHAFDDKDFDRFDRVRHPDVIYAGMLQYDGELLIPRDYLVPPPSIDRTISEYLAKEGVAQYAVSETQKFGHVTYFWNGNRGDKFNDELEVYEEVPSDKVQFDERPWMKSAEITDKMIEAVRTGRYRFLRMNYPNGDMVGHTGMLEAAVIAAEAVDLCLGRLIRAVEEAHGVALITADHGNLEEMFETDKKGVIIIDKKTGQPQRKTAHTLNKVPFIIYDPEFRNEYRLREFTDTPAACPGPVPTACPGLANVAGTILFFLGYEAPEDYLPSIIEAV